MLQCYVLKLRPVHTDIPGMRQTCAAPLAHKLRIYFLQMRVSLDGMANTRHTVLAIARGELKFVSFCMSTKGMLCTVWTRFYI